MMRTPTMLRVAVSARLLSQSLTRAQSTCTSAIPIIDITPLREANSSHEAKKAVAQKIAAACEEVGFFVATHHGVPQSTIDAAWKTTSDFFDLPIEAKVGEGNHLLMSDAFPYGYSPFGGETLSKGKTDVDGSADDDAGVGKKGDMKEMFSVGPYQASAGMPLPRYPPTPANMRADWQNYFEAMEGLSASLMRGFALSLELDEHWFVSKNDKHASSLRALNYPALGAGSPHQPKPGQMRASAHTDYGVLTILKSGGPGLQVKLRDGEWHDAPFVEDGFVINLGDLMSRWTNDKWLSTPHRVIEPQQNNQTATNSTESSSSSAGAKGTPRRQSLAYFANLNMDAHVEAIPTCVSADRPAKYPPTMAGDHLMAKHSASTRGILDDSWMKDMAK